ncbi:MAG: hypothetical protein ACM34K_11010 [Bacillota bacterium]
MYTSHIGKKFLEYYNSRNKTSLTARDYFETVFFPLFYDNERYLQSVANTPLFQLIAQKNTSDPAARQKKKEEIISKISAYVSDDNYQPEMSFAVGYASADLEGTTSGQVTSINLPLNEEDMFASWIGAGLGIGVHGGLNLLIDNDIIFSAIEEGWPVYRKYVNENPDIDNKIETWNSIWLTHRFSRNWNADSQVSFFNPLTLSKSGTVIMERPSWVQILFSLAGQMPQTTLNVYVYSFGQMNKTIGFVQFRLPQVTRLSDLYSVLFEKQTGLSNKKLAELYQTEYGLSTACEKFSLIGLRSLEPRDIKKFMPSRNEKSFPSLKSDESSLINYSIYITWIIAMLNNKELLELAEKSAQAFSDFVSRDRQAKKLRTNVIEKVLSARSRKDFIEGINVILDEDKSLQEVCCDLVDQVMLNVATDNIPLFVTLLRFKYLSRN